MVNLCVKNKHRRRKKKIWYYISLVWKLPTGSMSRNKAGVHHMDWMDFLATWRQINHHICYFYLRFVGILPLSLQYAAFQFLYWAPDIFLHSIAQQYTGLIITEDLESFESCENMELKWARVTWISRISISLRGNEIQYHPWWGHPRFIATAISWVRFW